MGTHVVIINVTHIFGRSEGNIILHLYTPLDIIGGSQILDQAE